MIFTVRFMSHCPGYLKSRLCSWVARTIHFSDVLLQQAPVEGNTLAQKEDHPKKSLDLMELGTTSSLGADGFVDS